MTSTTLGYAFLGGLLPAFIWLYLILKEDASHPEPRSLIALTFLVGMVAVPIAAFLENYAVNLDLENNLPDIIYWIPLIEEVLKYAVAAMFILWRRAVDEAPDYIIYMITIALGFAAAENMLYIFNSSGGNLAGISHMRFIGSTVLHVVASASIGFALAFSMEARPHWRIVSAALGLILAIALHSAFNALMINEAASTALVPLFLVWIVAVIFFAAFEVLKYFQYRNLSNNT